MLRTALLVSVTLLAASPVQAQQQLPPVEQANAPALRVNCERLVRSLTALQAQLPGPAQEVLQKALRQTGKDSEVIEEAQRLLDPQCLVGIHINPESRVKAGRGPAPATLVQDGWTTFLIKVHNEAGVTQALRVASPHLIDTGERSKEQWLQAEIHKHSPMPDRLTGHELEYVIIRLKATEPGKREARLSFDVAQGNQDLGFRAEVPILFTVQPAAKPGQAAPGGRK
jgi:hypothetical protein